MKLFISVLLILILLLPLMSHHLLACEDVIITINKKRCSIKEAQLIIKQVKHLTTERAAESDFMLVGSVLRF